MKHASTSWNEHISYIANKISCSIGVIGKVKHSLPREALITLYYSLIYPYLTYCNLVWGRASSTSLNKLHLLQKKIVRIITFSRYTDHTLHLFQEIRIIPFPEVNKYLVSIFVYKCFHNILPSTFLHSYNLFSNSNRINTNTRLSESMFRLPFARTKLRQDFLFYQCIKIYNEFLLPLNLLGLSNSIHHFRKALKLILT